MSRDATQGRIEGIASVKTKKTKKREYFGERIAMPLLAWLHASDTPEAERRRVVKLFELGEAYQDSQDRHEREVLKERVNGILDGLKYSPMVSNDRGSWHIHWEAETKGSAADAVWLWLELVARGLLSRLRRCARAKCPRWYFKRFDHTTFCSVKCRNADTKENPTKIEARKLYEKRYYREQKEKAQEELKGVWS